MTTDDWKPRPELPEGESYVWTERDRSRPHRPVRVDWRLPPGARLPPDIMPGDLVNGEEWQP
jgi:hypothetical protein